MFKTFAAALLATSMIAGTAYAAQPTMDANSPAPAVATTDVDPTTPKLVRHMRRHVHRHVHHKYFAHGKIRGVKSAHHVKGSKTHKGHLAHIGKRGKMQKGHLAHLAKGKKLATKLPGARGGSN